MCLRRSIITKGVLIMEVSSVRYKLRYTSWIYQWRCPDDTRTRITWEWEWATSHLTPGAQGSRRTQARTHTHDARTLTAARPTPSPTAPALASCALLRRLLGWGASGIRLFEYKASKLTTLSKLLFFIKYFLFDLESDLIFKFDFYMINRSYLVCA